MNPKLTDLAIALDQNDPLADTREQFVLNTSEVYLDGNSLGPLPKSVSERVAHTLEEQWGKRLIRGWNEGWIDLPQIAGAKIASIIGAPSDCVICADSVSVNLFKLIAASMALDKARTCIVSVEDMFPTDLYITQGLEQLMPKGSCDVKLVGIDELDTVLDPNVNLVVLSHVNFRTGEAYDLNALTQMIQASGAKVLWDVSHSAGVLPIDVVDNNIDFVVGCGYKFLNGGPGAPAFLYARRDLQGKLKQPLSGWMGHADPFAFVNDYEAAPGMDRFLAGTPNILSLVALDEALGIYQELNLSQVFKKAQDLASFFAKAVSESGSLNSLKVISPNMRGAQVTLEHEQAFPITQALIDSGIICDFRTPNYARFGFSPLYIGFSDIEKAVVTLERIMLDEIYLEPKYQTMSKVT